MQPANPEDPATLDRTTMAVPAGTRVSVSPDSAITYELPSRSQLEVIRASTGIGRKDEAALRKADNKARAPLLYTAAGCLMLAVFFVWQGFPTPASLAGGAAAVCFAAWYAAGDRLLMYLVIGMLMLGGGVYLGYNRKEKEVTSEQQ